MAFHLLYLKRINSSAVVDDVVKSESIETVSIKPTPQRTLLLAWLNFNPSMYK